MLRFLALAFLCAASASAQVFFSVSTVATASGADTYGLDGATFTYSFTTASATTVDNGGIVNATIGTVSLAISGSDSHDGSYTLTQVYDSGAGTLGTTPVVYFAGSTIYLPIAAPSHLPDWVSNSGFTLDDIYATGGIGTTYGAGDTLDPADFTGTAVTFNSGAFTDGLGTVTYSFSPSTLNAAVAVPEPSALAALGGLVGLALVSVRRRRK